MKVNGAVENTKQVTLGAGSSTSVVFSVVKNVASSYSVDVNGVTGSFTVNAAQLPAEAPPSTPLVPLQPVSRGNNPWWYVIPGVVLVVVAVVGIFIYRVRRASW